jgi:hypothetical protein
MLQVDPLLSYYNWSFPGSKSGASITYSITRLKLYFLTRFSGIDYPQTVAWMNEKALFTLDGIIHQTSPMNV